MPTHSISKPFETPGSHGSAPRGKLLRIVKWCPTWPALILLALLLPSDLSFYLGPLRLTAYRLILLMALFPAISTVFSGRAGRAIVVDWLVLLHVGWAFVVIAYYHGLADGLQSGGIRFIEYAGAYFVARAYIVDERSFQGAVAFIIMTICLVLPFAIFESVTGINLIRQLATGGNFVSDVGKRWGLSRAFGPFDHPILLGVWAASVFGLAWSRVFPQMGHPRPRKSLAIVSLLTALASMSSGAISALMAQLTLMLWEARTRFLKRRWGIFVLLLFALYEAIELYSNRGAMKAVLSYLTFSAENAYGRIIIFEHGMINVWKHPILGLGFNQWEHPTWMSDSLDNFWLHQAVTFGIPGFVTFALPAILVLALGWRDMPPRLAKLRMAWTISMIGMIVSACTVHFWNQSFTYYALFLGMGVWFSTTHRKKAS